MSFVFIVVTTISTIVKIKYIIIIYIIINSSKSTKQKKGNISYIVNNNKKPKDFERRHVVDHSAWLESTIHQSNNANPSTR